MKTKLSDAQKKKILEASNEDLDIDILAMDEEEELGEDALDGTPPSDLETDETGADDDRPADALFVADSAQCVRFLQRVQAHHPVQVRRLPRDKAVWRRWRSPACHREASGGHWRRGPCR